MSGVHGHVLHHVVRRGLDAAQAHFAAYSPEYIQQLQTDAQAYENAGPQAEINPAEMLPVAITGIIFLLVIASVRYTVGEVIASLAMIESPSSIAIVDDKPPPYSDAVNDSTAKEPLLAAEPAADLEVTIVSNKPITAKITTSIGHLNRVGGFFARWRGLGLSFFYHSVHAVFTNLLASGLGWGILGRTLVYVFVSVCLARVHMVWTHAMIAHPSPKPFWHRIVPRKQCKAILLPSFVFAVAQQATFLIPLLLAAVIGMPHVHAEHMKDAMHGGCWTKMIKPGLILLIVPATGIFLVLHLLLPAVVTLTRVEALLLAEGEETVVPFDREALMGDIDVTVRGGCKALFVQVWRSFDRATRWRLIKLYGKMALIQIAVMFTAVHLMVAEIYVIGGDRLGPFFKSAIAQLKLMAIEQHQQNAN